MSATIHPLRGTLLEDPAPPLFGGDDTMPLPMALRLRTSFTILNADNTISSVVPLASIEEHFKSSISLALMQAGFDLPASGIITWQKLYRDPILQPLAIDVARTLSMQMQDIEITPAFMLQQQTETLAKALGCPPVTPDPQIHTPAERKVVRLSEPQKRP